MTLSCTSRGSPPDTFTWRKDDDSTVLQSTNITAVDLTSTSAVFRADYSIDNVTTSDSGVYTCNVTNPMGNDTDIITVVVDCKFLILHINNKNLMLYFINIVYVKIKCCEYYAMYNHYCCIDMTSYDIRYK